jgi:hypothetical protein
MYLMMRSLLADRFKLLVRQEKRELPVYVLVKARSDGGLGPRMKAFAVDCGPTGRGRGAPAPGTPPGPPAGCRALITPSGVNFEGPDHRPSRHGIRNGSAPDCHRQDGSGWRFRPATLIFTRHGTGGRSEPPFAVHRVAGTAWPEARIDPRTDGSGRDRFDGAADARLIHGPNRGDTRRSGHLE